MITKETAGGKRLSGKASEAPVVEGKRLVRKAERGMFRSNVSRKMRFQQDHLLPHSLEQRGYSRKNSCGVPTDAVKNTDEKTKNNGRNKKKKTP